MWWASWCAGTRCSMSCRRATAAGGLAIVISAGLPSAASTTGVIYRGKWVPLPAPRDAYQRPQLPGSKCQRRHLGHRFLARGGGLTGPIGLVCQSGATAFGPFLVRAVENGIGFSYIISTGTSRPRLHRFRPLSAGRSGYRVIAGFVEGFKRAETFRVAKLAAERGKPIVLIESGVQNWSRAARSHTAALTGAGAATMRSLPNRGDPGPGLRRTSGGSAPPGPHPSPASRHRGGLPLGRHRRSPPHGGQAGSICRRWARARDGINGTPGLRWAANPADVTGFATATPSANHGADDQ